MAVPQSALIIDDDPLVCELSLAYLGALGVKSVQAVSDGGQAIRMMSRADAAFDLILCDLNMPQLDGVQFFAHLAEIGFSGRIVIVSGEDSSVIDVARRAASARGLNVAGTMKKPVRKAALEALLKAGEQRAHGNAPARDHSFSARDLDRAIAAGDLVPYYLPGVDTRSAKVTDVEALARWKHREYGIIAPVDFIPLAEKTGRIGGVTDAILSRSLSDLAKWRTEGMDLGLAVNMSSQTLQDTSLPDELAARLADAGLPPDVLTIEVTERVILDPSPQVMEVLARLRIKRIRLAIDDFGTGFSNMEQLRHFPYSALKVDRAFVHNAGSDRFAATGLRASVMLAREMGMQVIAEGVENAADWLVARRENVDRLQGFGISQPLSTQQFEDWFRANDGRAPSALVSQVARAASQQAHEDLAEPHSAKATA